MQLVNDTAFAVDFFIRSTTTGTMVSKGWLDPGEQDVWEAPHYHHAGCNVRFVDHEGNAWSLDVPREGRVILRSADGTIAIETA